MLSDSFVWSLSPRIEDSLLDVICVLSFSWPLDAVINEQKGKPIPFWYLKIIKLQNNLLWEGCVRPTPGLVAHTQGPHPSLPLNTNFVLNFIYLTTPPVPPCPALAPLVPFVPLVPALPSPRAPPALSFCFPSA